MTNREQRIVAKTECTDPPDTVRTVADWFDWRLQENARMAKAIADQLAAHFERESGSTVH